MLSQAQAASSSPRFHFYEKSSSVVVQIAMVPVSSLASLSLQMAKHEAATVAVLVTRYIIHRHEIMPSAKSCRLSLLKNGAVVHKFASASPMLQSCRPSVLV